MIRILIITNDISSWVHKVVDSSREYMIKKSNRTIFITTPLFYITITSIIDDGDRGQRWNTIILDKHISNETYSQILLPSLWGIIDFKR